MTCSIVLLTLWSLFTLFSGMFVNYIASLTNIATIINLTSIVVNVFEVIFCGAGVIIFLIYLYSRKLERQLRNYCKDKKLKLSIKSNEIKTNLKSKIDKQWWAIENINK